MIDFGVAISILASIVIALFAIFSGHEIAIIFLCITIPVFIAGISVLADRNNDIISPMHVLYYMVFLGSFLKGSLLLFYDDAGDAAEHLLAGLPLSSLIGGGLALSLAVFAFAIGYAAVMVFGGPKRDVGRSSALPSQLRVRTFALASFFIAAIAIVAIFKYFNLAEAISEGAISTQRVQEDSIGSAPRGAALGYFRMLGQTVPQVLFAIVYALSFQRQNRLFDLFILVMSGIMAAIVPFVTSTRLDLVSIFFISLVIRHNIYKRISATKLAAFAIAAVVAVGFLGQLRDIRHGSEDIEIGSSLIESGLGLMQRPYFMDIGKTSVIVNRVPEDVDYLYGRSFIAIFVAPIPRTMWPEKPIVRIGPFVAEEIYGRITNSGIPPGFVGELYLNFGAPGVFLGMALIGALMASLYRKACARPQDWLFQVVYAISLFSIMFSLLSADFVLLISQLFRFGVPIFLAWLVLKPRQRRKIVRTRTARMPVADTG